MIEGAQKLSSAAGRDTGRQTADPSEGLGPRSALFAASAVGGLLVILVADEGYVAKVLAVAGMAGALVAHEWRRVGHPLTPMGIISMGGLLVFVLRPLTVLSTGETTAGAALDTRGVDAVVLHAGATALSQVIIFFAALGAVYLVRLGGSLRRRRTDVFCATPEQIRRAAQMLAVALVPAVVCTFVLVSSSGGIAAYVQGLSVRSSFLAGRYFLTLGYLPGSVALCVYLVLRQSRTDIRTMSPFAVTATVTVMASAFTGGGRGPLLLGVIVPLLIIKQCGPRPLRTAFLVGAGVVVFAAGMLIGIVLRDNVYTSGRAVEDLRDDPVAALGQRLTDGTETRPFDSLIVLNQAAEAGHLDLQRGRTYLSSVEWVFPSSVVGEKGGGNTWFTRTYLPRYYYPDKVETSISAPGEAYANFGWPGIAVVGALTGALAAGFSRAFSGAQGRGIVLSAKLAPAFFSFLRGDAYQNLALAGLIGGLAYLTFGLAMRAGPSRRS